jgi:ABC-type Fe3+/spermidine/putrescine transport system ATPase subunit
MRIRARLGTAPTGVLSDCIHIMNKGRIVQSGSPRDLFERPKSRFVAEFVGYANILPIDAADAKSGTVRLPGGNVIKVSCVPSAAMDKVLVVRPHRIGLVHGPSNDSNVIEGRVRSAAFLGDRTHLSVDVVGCGTVLADIVSLGIALPEKGEQVKLGFSADAAIVL